MREIRDLRFKRIEMELQITLLIYIIPYIHNSNTFCPICSTDKYPYGVKKLHMYHTSPVTLVLIAPGKFHDASRVYNTIDIDRGHEHAFRIRYITSLSILQALCILRVSIQNNLEKK